MSNLFGREPALILAAVNAVVVLGVGFGLPVTGEQVALINAAVAALLGVVVRSQVTPVTDAPEVHVAKRRTAPEPQPDHPQD